ncbi:phospholipase D-like domain-containing protein [Maritimibacter fusiformis]|uniref:Phospholipase D n=1 Tax=Maritimibacter fusiformis TaxID=2603819 RepID=A0A5D0RPM8_9RHOB|nr:phosphatidylserine/phosphatidylglycerophosphate/cardiolipin synthase family protein [Maritimibacter fusiformis]TYB82521.1 phosphatidylserine/phosphatidylglycerophosphate/cardiolipin synthase family protein [Maritimibacter fusiformis]
MRQVRTGRALAVLFAAFALVSGCSEPQATPPIAVPAGGTSLAATVFLSQSGPDRDDAVFHFPAVANGETRVALASTASRPMAARLSCDGPARLQTTDDSGPGEFMRPGGVRAVSVPAAGANLLPELLLPPGTEACEITWGADNRLSLRSDAAPEPAGTTPHTCPTPNPAPTDALAQVFFSERALDLTCAAPTGNIVMVPDEIDGLKWRIDRLTGGNVSRAALEAGDPDMALDFSKAPHFDEIVISYLLIRSDLSGWLTTRTLAYHAARGTRIRVLTSDALMPQFDRAPLEALAAAYPGVSLQYFKYPSRGPGSIIDNVQRANHVKLFLGLSPEPGRSFALIGGRNLADGYFFDGAIDQPDHPFLRSYDDTKRGFGVVFYSLYDDFEMALTDRDRVEELARQFDRYYLRDTRVQAMQPVAAGPRRPPPPASGTGLVRHFISLPWADGRAHEAYYVDLFDAARSEIFIVSPFNYPTPAIHEALVRAAARGVDVRIVTRRGGDEPPSSFTRALNTRYGKTGQDKFRFRYFGGGARLLHAKIIVIDGRLGVVASTNLNRRSYIHDTENGLVFLDRKVARALHAEAELFWAMGGTEDDPDDRALAIGMFEAIPWLEQFF